MNFAPFTAFPSVPSFRREPSFDWPVIMIAAIIIRIASLMRANGYDCWKRIFFLFRFFFFSFFFSFFGGGGRGRGKGAVPTCDDYQKKRKRRLTQANRWGGSCFFLGFFLGGGLFCFEMLRWCGFSTVREMENPQKKRSISLFILLFFLLPVLIISFFFLCSSRSPWVVCPDWRRFFYCRFVSFPYSVLFVFLCVFSIVFFAKAPNGNFRPAPCRLFFSR